MQQREILQERLQQIPGVREASVDQAMPTRGGFQMEYALPSERFGPDMDIKMPHADLEFVDAHFLSSMRIPIMAGRAFTESEYERGNPVALINRTFARRLFGDSDPMGRMLRVPPLIAGYAGVERPKESPGDGAALLASPVTCPTLGCPAPHLENRSICQNLCSRPQQA